MLIALHAIVGTLLLVFGVRDVQCGNAGWAFVEGSLMAVNFVAMLFRIVEADE